MALLILFSNSDKTLPIQGNFRYTGHLQENYGLLDDSSSTLIKKYNDMSKSALKSSLKSLKMSNAPLAEIKYLEKFLHSKLQPTAHSALAGKNHDIQIQKNFWGYIKENFKQSMSPSPTFDCSTCTQFSAHSFLVFSL